METQVQVNRETTPEPVDLAGVGEQIITGKLGDKLQKWFLALASVYVLWLVVQAIVHFR